MSLENEININSNDLKNMLLNESNRYDHHSTHCFNKEIKNNKIIKRRNIIIMTNNIVHIVNIYLNTNNVVSMIVFRRL